MRVEMRRLQDSPIKGKLIRISLLTTAAALFFANLILIANELFLFHRSLVDNLTIQAKMIGDHCTTAILFNDPKAAAETLSVLEASPNIVFAAIYSKDGEIFASYHRPGSPVGDQAFPREDQGFQFRTNSFNLTQTIVFNDKVIGKVNLQSNLNQFFSLIQRYVLIVSIVLIFSLLVAFFLFSKLHQTITTPIHQLVGLMAIISKDKNYSLRAPVLQNDELGSMAQGFNEMLEQIQLRDRELELHRIHLEDQVGIRTADLAKANIQLEKELADRKQTEMEKSLLEDQLRQSQKMEAIGRLAGGIAHDFNNLLTIIQGYSELGLLRLPKEDPTHDTLEQIKKAGDRASDLTRQLLAFSRRQMLQMKIIDLNVLIQNLDKMLHRILREDIKVIHSLSPDLGKIRSDPGQIEQVILNLTINARDAMPFGGKLLISTENIQLDKAFAQIHPGVTPGPYVKLTVTDTGTGMTPEVKERIFEPFFTTKELGKGTGLGLSTIYGIIKQSDGNIWVYSQPNQGTTFEITLPRIDEIQEPDDSISTASEIPKGTETILVVEDETDVGKIIQKALQECGYEVFLATNGFEAIQMVREFKNIQLNLLLTDVVLPGMSGREIRDHVTRLRPGIKVIFMSGYTDDAVIRHGIRKQEMDFIQKPFSMNALACKVREVLDFTQD